jgi:hypothetical protein
MKPGSTGLMTSIIGILPNQMRPSKRAILPLRPYHPNHPHYRAREASLTSLGELPATSLEHRQGCR